MGYDATVDRPPTRVQVFGGVRIWHGDVEVDPGSARQRTLLATLIVADGATVSASRLLRMLWSGEAPSSGLNQLQRLVGQVRRTLEPDLAPRATGINVLAAGTGYRFEPAGIQTDLAEFRQRVHTCRLAFERGDRAAGLESARDALGLARLPALSDMDGERYDAGGGADLERERASTCAYIAGVATEDADPQLISLIESIATDHRLNESLQASVITLLASRGRRAEALTLFETVRRTLSIQLGVDPGRELLEAHTRALMARPSVTDHRVPTEPQDRSPLGSVVVVAGMTTLAIKWARDVWDDSQLSLNLRGFDLGDNPISAYEALAALLAAVGVHPML